MQFTAAQLSILGTTPMTHSHHHTEPKLKGESPDDYDKRTWRSKLNVEEQPDGKPSVVIPAHGFQQALAAAATYSRLPGPGKGPTKWTKTFMAGLLVVRSPALDVDPDTLSCITIFANSDGKRGGGKRVPRALPFIPPGWQANVELMILDPAITQSVFREMAEICGMFVGLGQFRPQNGGTNGRFIVTKLDWEDNREIVPGDYQYMNNKGRA